MAQDPGHWDEIYRSKPAGELSWTAPELGASLSLLERFAPPPASVVDVGAGRSPLAGALLERGWTDLTVVDISADAFAAEPRDPRIATVVADVTAWDPGRRFDAWHDRAALHFLVGDDERAAYASVLASALAAGGVAIIGCFAPDGPETCSGLPVRRASAEQIAADLGESFALEHAEAEVHRTPWGAEQRFAWAVLRRCSPPH